MAKNQYVVKHGPEWAVRTENATRVTKVFHTQLEAIEFAKPIARTNNTELRIQDRNGKFRVCNSYGNDPCPPKDLNR